MPAELDYLFLAAHPDDAELYCGGLILKMRQRGYRVGIVDCTRGEAGTHGSAAERAAETAAANAILQPAVRENLGLPDGRLTDDQPTRAALVAVLRRLRPHVLVAPLGPCRHPDHTALWQLARAAHFLAGVGGFAGELPPWRPLRLLCHPEYAEATPSFIVDISAQYADRARAVAAYRSQFYVPGAAAKTTVVGSRAFHERLLARHRLCGAQIGVEYGEPYVVEEPPRIDDPLRSAREG